MAPNLNNSGELLLKAVNLSRLANTVRDIKGIIELRSKYRAWKKEVEDVLNNNKSIDLNKKLIFFQTDPVADDIYGAGIEFNSERVEQIIETIKVTLAKWIDYLSETNLNDELPARYEPESNTLHFKGQLIKISARAQNNAADLLRTLFKKPEKVWATDEVLEDWNEKTTNTKRIYFAGKSVNDKINQKTACIDFLVVTTKDVRINPNYI